MYLVGVISMCFSEGGTSFLDGEQTSRQQGPEAHKPRPASAPAPHGEGVQSTAACVSRSIGAFSGSCLHLRAPPGHTSEKQGRPSGPSPRVSATNRGGGGGGGTDADGGGGGEDRGVLILCSWASSCSLGKGGTRTPPCGQSTSKGPRWGGGTWGPALWMGMKGWLAPAQGS